MSRIKTQSIHVVQVTSYTYNGWSVTITGELLSPSIPDICPQGRFPIDVILPDHLRDKLKLDDKPIIKITYMGDNSPNGESMLQTPEIWDTKTQHWKLP